MNSITDEWVHRLWRTCGVPDRFLRTLTTDGWGAINDRGGQISTVVKGARFYTHWPWSSGLLLSGPVGCGKTLIVCCVIREMILTAQGVGDEIPPGFHYQDNYVTWYPSICFVNVPHLFTEIKGTFGRQSYTDPRTMDVLERYMHADVLALDDIGAEAPSEWVKSTLFEIIDDRYGAERPTIFTSNFHLDALSGRIGERVADRIAEMCAPHIYEIGVGSYRMQKAKQAREKFEQSAAGGQGVKGGVSLD